MICEVCKQSIVGMYIHFGNKKYHQHCYDIHIVPRCIYCGTRLTSQYLVDQWGGAFCAEHQKTYLSCSFCGRLVPPKQVIHAQQPIRCTDCSRTAIERVDQAHPIFTRLVQWFHHEGLSCNQLQLQIELTDRAQLNNLEGGAFNNHTLGLTIQRVSAKGGTRQGVDKVAVLRGMPSVLFEGVASHELGHVWLAIQVKAPLPSWAEEGFCELIAYRRYTVLNSRESLYYAKQTATNPDPIYGEGFRRVHTIERSIGFAPLILHLRQTGRMPIL